MNTKRTTAIVAGAAVLALGGAAIANAAGDREKADKPIPTAQHQRAADAALAAVPGRVSGTEVGDEEGAYEVEVTRPDGREVDVHLDEQFSVTSEVAEEAEAGDEK